MFIVSRVSQEDDFDYERTQEERQIFKAFNRISNVINGKLWEFYKRYQPGRYKEPDLRTSLEETDSFSKRIQKIQKVIELDSSGIKMIFHLSHKKNASSSLRRTRKISRTNGSRTNGSRGSRSRSDRSDRSRSDRSR